MWIIIRRMSTLLVGLLGIPSLVFASPPTTLQVAISEAAPPTSYVLNNQPAGMLRELLEALFNRMPAYRLQFHAYPWVRAQWAVQNGAADIFVTFPSANRNSYANFTNTPLYILDYGCIIYDRTSDKALQIETARSFSDLRELTFISQESVAWETENIPAYIHRYVINHPASLMHMAFRRKTGDFFIMNAEQAIYYARQLGYQDQLGIRKVKFIPNSHVPLHIGIRKSHPASAALMAGLEAAMKEPEFLEIKRQIEGRYHRQVDANFRP